jgi:hypothetical protein
MPILVKVATYVHILISLKPVIKYVSDFNSLSLVENLLPWFLSLDTLSSGLKDKVQTARDGHYSGSVQAGTPKANSSSYYPWAEARNSLCSVLTGSQGFQETALVPDLDASTSY